MSSNRESSSYPCKLSLKNFFIYNVSYGQKEGEEEKKIIYYYPKGTNVDIQIKDVGLSEAIIKFAGTFSIEACEALHTEKTRRLFFSPEPNFFMVLTANVPTAFKGKDGLDGLEYQGNKVQNKVFLSVLQQAYSAARMFIGPFTRVLDNDGGETETLKRKLDSFYAKYLSQLHLNCCDIMDVFRGVCFLPLDKGTFLQAQSFINHLESSNSKIKFTVLFFDERLVWSGIPQDDMQIFYSYIINSLLPTYRLSLEQTNKSHLPPDLLDSSGRFISGPRNMNDTTYPGNLIKVYLNSIPEPGFYNLIVYKYGRAVLCWFIDSGETYGEEMMRELESGARAGLSDRLLEDMAVWRPDPSPSADEPRYVYFNRMNLAVKSNAESGSADSASRILVTMHHLNSRLLEEGCHSGETIVKTTNDVWLAGRMSNSREFFVVLDKKKMNLIDASDEVNKVCEKQLKGIFFQV